MKTLLALKNGQLLPDESSVITYLNPRYPHEEGVYESVRTYHGHPFRLDAHLKRLEYSAQLLEFSLPKPVHVIEQWTIDVIQQAADPLQFLLMVATPEDVIILSRELNIDESLYAKGYRCVTVELERKKPEAKSLLARSISAEANRKAQQLGADEAILVNHEGICTEAAFSNLFWVKDAELFTSTKNALHGMTQEAVMEIASESSPVQEGILKREDFKNLDELFLTVTSRGIVPVVEVDERIIANGKPGPMTRDLLERFDDLTERTCSL